MAKDAREQVVQSAARLRTMLEELERLVRDPAARADQLNRLQQRIMMRRDLVPAMSAGPLRQVPVAV